MTGTDSIRLPATVTPSRYDLVLEPDLEGATFQGTEAVAVEVHEPVDEIVLHAQHLTVDEAWLDRPDGTRLDATASLDEERQELRLALSGTAAPGEWTLHTRFAGTLNDKLVGFYRSTFTDDAGEKRTLACTQFEAPYARWAFPCWDEPEHKAVFGITLMVDPGLLAISNSAEVSDEPTDDGRRRIRFADTMKMSTYLVAFVVGPLEATEPIDVDGVPLRIVVPPGKLHLTDFAAGVGAFSLRFLADWYGSAYPGDKLDLVAIPDFSFGAMENLGCVTFRETALLLDGPRATQADQQRVADVIAHEIAHMWFGDLVTMRWWNGIWLNEAFATFMEMLTTDAYRPDWERWTDFGIARSAAFDTDSLSSTRPIEFTVNTPAEAEGMFDVLTYEKGSSVVRMLEQYLGEDRFREGIRHYLDTHRYGNTETTDLWDAIESATGEPVRRIMDTWIFQPGHPAVTVERSDDGRTVTLRQHRFRFVADATAGADAAAAADDVRFAVPVVLRVGRGDTTEIHRVLLDDAETTVELDAAAGWVLGNHEGNGFYRVQYSDADLRALAASAMAVLSPLERYGLVEDEWAFVLAGRSDSTRTLGLLRHLADEHDLAVWQRITGVLGGFDRLVPDDARPALQQWIRGLVGPAARRLGTATDADEPARTRALRATLFEALALLGDDQPSIERAAALFDQLGDDPNAVDPDMASAVLRVVAAQADAARWEQIRARARSAGNPQDAVRHLTALGATDDATLVARFCELTLTDEIRTQDAPHLLGRALQNRVNGPIVWRFVTENWDALLDRFPTPSIGSMLGGIRTFNDPGLADEVEAFLDLHPVPQAAKQIAQHRERMRVAVAVRAREADTLASALE
ncbi:MAG: putative aminopeptidase [Acidimicrobiales bacterium]|nr:putative aminopeptidase [Acidimicrobiales bacterium]